MPVASSAPRGGVHSSGIRKRRFDRKDRDGDVVMGAVPKATTPRPTTNKPSGNPKYSSSLTDLEVTGWTDESEIPRITQFLERHASKRSTNATTKRGPPQTMIKKSRVEGNVLHIRVLPDNVVPFSKINGFSFRSTHGEQKLTITGPGIRRRSASPHTTDPTQGKSVQANGVAKNTTADVDVDRNERTGTVLAEVEAFLNRHYNPEVKLLDLGALATDAGLQQLGIFENETTAKKLFPVLTTVIDEKIPTTEAKQAAFESVILSRNSLENLHLVKTLAYTLPDIKNLDLSFNNFPDTKALLPWRHKFRDLEQLILTGNPLEAQPGWEQEIISWFPKLHHLNGVQIRP